MSLATPRKGYKSVPWLFGKTIDIPQEWEVKKCSKILELKHGYQFRDEDFIEGKKGIKIIKIGNLKQNGSIDSNNCDIISLDRKSDFLNVVINSGDVLMALTGATLGKIIQVPKINEILLQNYRVGNFFPKKDFDKNFLYCVLKNIFTQKQIWFLVNSSAQPNIGKEDFDKIKIICPSLPEQQKIATILSNVDNLIESTEKVITHSKKVKTGLMQKLLTRGIGHVTFKKVPWLFGKKIEIPEEWEVRKLDSLVTLLTNGFVGKAKEHYTESENGVLYIQGYNIEENNFKFHGIKYVTPQFHKQQQKSNLQLGDLLTVQTGNVGTTAIISKSLVGANCHALIISRFKKEIADSDYFCQYFNSRLCQKSFKSIEIGTSLKHLNGSDMKRLQFLLPPLPEQQKIATILSNIDSKITSQVQYKEKLEKLKKSLMQKILTGEVRV